MGGGGGTPPAPKTFTAPPLQQAPVSDPIPNFFAQARPAQSPYSMAQATGAQAGNPFAFGQFQQAMQPGIVAFNSPTEGQMMPQAAPLLPVTMPTPLSAHDPRIKPVKDKIREHQEAQGRFRRQY